MSFASAADISLTPGDGSSRDGTGGSLVVKSGIGAKSGSIIISSGSIRDELLIIHNFLLIIVSACNHHYNFINDNLKIKLWQISDYYLIMNISLLYINNFYLYIMAYIWLLIEVLLTSHLKIIRIICFFLVFIKGYILLYQQNKIIFLITLISFYGYKCLFNSIKRKYFTSYEVFYNILSN
jgi:hypothetical protein